MFMSILYFFSFKKKNKKKSQAVQKKKKQHWVHYSNFPNGKSVHYCCLIAQSLDSIAHGLHGITCIYIWYGEQETRQRKNMKEEQSTVRNNDDPTSLLKIL
jgi:hypothetical protein